MQNPIQDALRGGERYVGTLAVSQLGDLVQYYIFASITGCIHQENICSRSDEAFILL